MLPISLVLLSSEVLTPAGFLDYRPKVQWIKRAERTHGGLRVELYASATEFPKGNLIWFQTRLVNLTQRLIRFPKANLTGELQSQAWSQVAVGDRTLFTLGDEPESARQVCHCPRVEESRFFALEPGQPVVLATESIRGYLEFRKPGVTSPQKGDLEGARETLLKPGEYRYRMTFGYRHPSPRRFEQYGEMFSYKWTGRTEAWSKAAPQGEWAVTTNFRVTSRDRND